MLLKYREQQIFNLYSRATTLQRNSMIIVLHVMLALLHRIYVEIRMHEARSSGNCHLGTYINSVVSHN